MKKYSVGIDWEDIALISFEQGNIDSYEVHKDYFISETNYLLEFLASINLKCTFFAQAQTAQNHPNLLKLIAKEGHSIGSHGLKHIARKRLTDKEFLNDCIESKKILEDIVQEKIEGYRSPLLSISRDSYYESLEILKNSGFKYDSSIPLHKLKKLMISLKINNIKQFPIRVVPLTSFENRFFSFNLAGGSTWRVLPFFLTSLILRSKLTSNNTSFYLHPYEFGAKIDPYRAISSNASKFKIYLKSMRWNLNKKAIEKVLISMSLSRKTILTPIN